MRCIKMKYQITLWVTLEEELAVMQLFHGKGWPYIKFQNTEDKGLFTSEDITPAVAPSEQYGTMTSLLSQTSIPRQDIRDDNRETADHTVYNISQSVTTESGLNSASQQGSMHTADSVQVCGSNAVQHEEIEVTYLLSDGTTVSVESLTEVQGSEPNEMITEEVISTEICNLGETRPLYEPLKNETEVNTTVGDVLSGNTSRSDQVNGGREGLISKNDIIYELALDLKSFQNCYSNGISRKGNSFLSSEERNPSSILRKQEKENRSDISVSENMTRKTKKKSQKAGRRVKSVKGRVAVPLKEHLDSINKMSLVISKETAGMNKSVCCMCNEEFDDLRTFEAHADVCLAELIHRSDSTLYKCRNCKAGFRQASTLLRHRLSQVCQPGTLQKIGEFLTCRHCGKLFKSTRLTDYTIHLLKHRKERAHVCDLCGKAFLRANTLRDHKRSHTGETPYKCRYCCLGFTSAAGRVNHEKTNHLPIPKRCVCEKCGASFKFSKGLYGHIREVHNAEYTFKCEHCNRVFKRRGTLNRHMKQHTSTKDKVCDVCGKAFLQKTDLNLHLKRHKNERSLFCKECGKGFYTRQTLDNHLRTHTGEKPFQCSGCSYKCNNGGNLSKHMRARHPELLIQT